jgi:tetrahydromethanopterin S-methyltransferase subunit G
MNLVKKVFEKRPTILYDIVFWGLLLLLIYAVLASIFGWPYIELSA